MANSLDEMARIKEIAAKFRFMDHLNGNFRLSFRTSISWACRRKSFLRIIGMILVTHLSTKKICTFCWSLARDTYYDYEFQKKMNKKQAKKNGRTFIIALVRNDAHKIMTCSQNSEKKKSRGNLVGGKLFKCKKKNSE